MNPFERIGHWWNSWAPDVLDFPGINHDGTVNKSLNPVNSNEWNDNSPVNSLGAELIERGATGFADSVGAPQSTSEATISSNTGSHEENSDNPYQVGSMQWLTYEASNGNEAAIDLLYNYKLSEESANSARAWTANREDTQYQRMVKDLHSVGVNPYFALSGASPVSSSSQGVNYQGQQFTSRGSTLKNIDSRELINAINAGVSAGNSILGLIGKIVSAVIGKKKS